VPFTADDFVVGLRRQVPRAGALIDEHRSFYDDLLLHVLVADLRRMALDLFESGDAEGLVQLLDVIDHGIREGDDAVRNAVAVSFIEDTGCWEPAMQGFIDTWPPAIRTEADRQSRASPGEGAP
jgi:hypothetical protein